MPIFRRQADRRDGLLHVLISCLWICLLLAVNGILVAMIHSQMDLTEGIWVRYPRLSQAAVFTTPLLLLVAELWLFDLLVDIASRRRTADDRDAG